MEKAVLIAGIIKTADIKFEDISDALAKTFGIVPSHVSPEIDFDFTDYYEKEMGPGLRRLWVGFFQKDQRFDVGKLATFKNLARGIEKDFCRSARDEQTSQKEKRRVNIDPGYLTPSKLVLASTKDFSHRIYLSDGIFAEVTLIFSDGQFNPLPWTYPDYQSEVFIDFAVRLRNTLIKAGK